MTERDSLASPNPLQMYFPQELQSYQDVCVSSTFPLDKSGMCVSDNLFYSKQLHWTTVVLQNFCRQNTVISIGIHAMGMKFVRGQTFPQTFRNWFKLVKQIHLIYQQQSALYTSYYLKQTMYFFDSDRTFKTIIYDYCSDWLTISVHQSKPSC